MTSIRSATSTVLTAAACAMLTGCGCDTYLAYGIFVQVEDAATKLPIVGPAARVTARDGAFVDSSLTAPASLAAERAGTYLVTVQAPGYQEWRRPVRVREDGCHVKTENLTASLQPLT